MLIPTLLIAVVLMATMAGAFVKYRDTFHPALLMGPMVGFHYVYSPLALEANKGYFGYLTEDHVARAQWIHLFGVIAMCVGFTLGPLYLTPRDTSADGPLGIFDKKTLVTASLVFAGLGILSFVYGIENVGGWNEAYGTSYGGGWIESGWLRDLVLLCLPALMLFTLGQGDQPITRRQLYLALPMISPFLIHGLIGARRGPTFMTFAGATMVYYMARRRRPTLPVLLVGGGLLGMLMLVLVANRRSIYWGTDLKVESVDDQTSSYLRTAEGNDYIYGAGLVIVSDELKDFAWGSTYLTTLFIRPIPKSIWPTKYEDAAKFFNRPALTTNLGVDITSFTTVLGWTASIGAAPGIIGDMWREFSWGMVPVLFGICWFYGHAWRRATEGGGWVPIYCYAISLSLYLVMQTLEAMLYRFLYGLVPMLWVLHKAAKKSRERNRTVAALPRTAEVQPTSALARIS